MTIWWLVYSISIGKMLTIFIGENKDKYIYLHKIKINLVTLYCINIEILNLLTRTLKFHSFRLP